MLTAVHCEFTGDMSQMIVAAWGSTPSLRELESCLQDNCGDITRQEIFREIIPLYNMTGRPTQLTPARSTNATYTFSLRHPVTPEDLRTLIIPFLESPEQLSITELLSQDTTPQDSLSTSQETVQNMQIDCSTSELLRLLLFSLPDLQTSSSPPQEGTKDSLVQQQYETTCNAIRANCARIIGESASSGFQPMEARSERSTLDSLFPSNPVGGETLQDSETGRSFRWEGRHWYLIEGTSPDEGEPGFYHVGGEDGPLAYAPLHTIRVDPTDNTNMATVESSELQFRNNLDRLRIDLTGYDSIGIGSSPANLLDIHGEVREIEPRQFTMDGEPVPPNRVTNWNGITIRTEDNVLGTLTHLEPVPNDLVPIVDLSLPNDQLRQDLIETREQVRNFRPDHGQLEVLVHESNAQYIIASQEYTVLLCSECGSTEVARTQWVNLNSGESVEGYHAGGDIWCMSCRSVTSLRSRDIYSSSLQEAIRIQEEERTIP